ncbi:MAG: nucleotide exchange factor GrpE [Azospirillaceae bacterium]
MTETDPKNRDSAAEAPESRDEPTGPRTGSGNGTDAGETPRPEGGAAESPAAANPGADPAVEAEEPLLEAEPLDAEVARLQEENAKLRDQALRAMAEVENVRRRAQKEKEDASKFAISKFAGDLLDPIDNLRRALEAAPDDPAQAGPEALTTLLDGVSATERGLLAAFERHGLVRVDPAGEAFDPNYHEAMFEVPNSGQKPGTVVQVLQPGYVLNGRLVRPARVGVAKGEPAAKVDTSV